MQRLLGIDASTKRTAISVFDDGEYVEYKYIDLHTITDSDKRINLMMDEIVKVLNHYSPTVIYQEDAWVGTNAQISMMLTLILGVVKYWCYKHNCVFHKVKPSMWRNVLGLPNGRNIKRAEAKQNAMNYVFEKYEVDAGDDVADAICVGEAGTIMFGGKGYEG